MGACHFNLAIMWMLNPNRPCYHTHFTNDFLTNIGPSALLVRLSHERLTSTNYTTKVYEAPYTNENSPKTRHTPSEILQQMWHMVVTRISFCFTCDLSRQASRLYMMAQAMLWLYCQFIDETLWTPCVIWIVCGVEGLTLHLHMPKTVGAYGFLFLIEMYLKFKVL